MSRWTLNVSATDLHLWRSMGLELVKKCTQISSICKHGNSLVVMEVELPENKWTIFLILTDPDLLLSETSTRGIWGSTQSFLTTGNTKQLHWNLQQNWTKNWSRSLSLLVVLMSYLGGEASTQINTLSTGDPFNYMLENSL